MLGFGSIGQGMLPLLLSEVGLRPAQVTVVNPGGDPTGEAAALGVRVLDLAVTPGNHRMVLADLLGEGDFLLNLSLNVESLAVMRLCRERRALYCDACTEPWPGRYDDPRLPPTQRTNYTLREEVLALGGQGPTALVTQGANPGVVSFLLKEALLRMAAETGVDAAPPAAPQDWAGLAQRLGIRVIHVAERDSQVASRRRQRGEFVNTWSVDGFVEEGLQPAELGWGSHERHWPADAQRHGHGCDAAILLNRPGLATQVRSWTPLAGPYHGFLVTHAESVSIADYLTLRDPQGRILYRPTVHYAYHPCEDTVASLHELAGRNWQLQAQRRILRDEIVAGMDELGVLLLGNPRGGYWYGSRLGIEQARALAPCNSATTLQVVAGLLAAMAWGLRHPRAGVVEPDAIDHAFALEVARPWLGEVVGAWTDWTPLKDRHGLFPQPLDLDDPWQFINFRVA